MSSDHGTAHIILSYNDVETLIHAVSYTDNYSDLEPGEKEYHHKILDKLLAALPPEIRHKWS